MADWESFREVLKDQYLINNHTLKYIREYMIKEHNFNRSKGQYETQFRKWDWRKNLSESEWKYVARKLKERGNRRSAVYFHGKIIPLTKVNKEISRHVMPTFAIPSAVQVTTSVPRGIVISTPPPSSPVNFAPGLLDPIAGMKRLLSSPSCANPPRFKRQHTISTQAYVGSAQEMAYFDLHKESSVMEVDLFGTSKSTKLKLDNLPFLKFRQAMRSQDMKNAFEQIMNFNANQVDSLLLQSLSYCPKNLISMHNISTPDLDLDLEVSESPLSYLPALETPKQLYHSFGTQILQCNLQGEDLDAFEMLGTVRKQLSTFLVNIPHTSQDEITENMEILCGPPTMQAAKLFVELGVYFTSNNLEFWGGPNKLSSWMIENLPWPAIRSMLSIDLLTVQTFAEHFLAAAVELGNVVIVKDLLKLPRVITHVRSSDKTLYIAVINSHAEIVTLLLNARSGVNREDRGDKYHPLFSFVETIEVAQILIESGADPNAVDKYDFQCLQILCPTLTIAVARGHIQLVRYLIDIGANMDTLSLIYSAVRFDRVPSRAPSRAQCTALSLAVDLKHLEIVHLLLQKGADSNGVFARIRRLQNDQEFLYGDKPNKSNTSTSLQEAARLGSLKTARLLLQFGADINAVSPSFHGKTALEAARIAGHAEMVALLLENGAKPESSISCEVPFTERALDEDLYEALRDQLELREAVIQDDLDRVKELVNAGMQLDMQIMPGSFSYHSSIRCNNYNSNYMDTEQGTILHWAICKKETRLDLVKFLLSKIRDINAQNENDALRPILHLAVEMGNPEVVRILIEAGVDVNSVYCYNCFYETPLLLAALIHAYDIVLQLLENRADVNAVVGDLKCPIVCQHECYRRNYYYTTAFQASLGREGRQDGQQDNVIKCLLSHGASLNAPVARFRGYSELTLAVILEDTKLVQQLIDLGADINCPAAQFDGRTALQAAAEISAGVDLEMVELLLRNGADVNAPRAPYDGVTPLLVAARYGEFQIARVLLDAGADPNTEGAEEVRFEQELRELALEGAVRCGRLDLARLLLEAGADPQMPGHTLASEIARKHGHIAIAEMIEEWLRTHEVRDAGKNDSDMLEGEDRVMELD